MSKFMLFVSAVFAHWLFTFGGIAMLGVGLWERFQNKQTAKWVFWGLAVALLVVGFYQAWLDEHNNTEIVIIEKAKAVGDLGTCGGDLKSANAQVRLLESQVGSQQATINGQQANLSGAQGNLNSIHATMDSCVVALGKQNIPEPQKFTLLMDVVPPRDAKWKHAVEIIAVTNKPVVAKVKLACGAAMDDLTARIAGSGTSFLGSTRKMFANEWLINYPSPMVTAVAPLVMDVSYNADDIGVCSLTPP